MKSAKAVQKRTTTTVVVSDINFQNSCWIESVKGTPVADIAVQFGTTMDVVNSAIDKYCRELDRANNLTARKHKIDQRYEYFINTWMPVLEGSHPDLADQSVSKQAKLYLRATAQDKIYTAMDAQRKLWGTDAPKKIDADIKTTHAIDSELLDAIRKARSKVVDIPYEIAESSEQEESPETE